MANTTHKAQNLGLIRACGGFGGLPTDTVDALEEGRERGGLMEAHTLVGFG